MNKADFALYYLENLINVKEFFQGEVDIIRDELKRIGQLEKQLSVLQEKYDRAVELLGKSRARSNYPIAKWNIEREELLKSIEGNNEKTN